ncbi:MAG: hypothetical protein HOH74_17675, partial [Gemmatimonadetes bacterium]|nr:hypothetical protein [Gemmatimonadota bacterium]
MRSVILLPLLALGLALGVPSAQAAGLQELQRFSDAYAELAAQVSPAVVAVKTERE